MRHLGHPDDIAARAVLIDEFVHLRRDAGLVTRDIAAQLGIAHSAVSTFESRRPSNPLVDSLVRYGRTIGKRPVLELRGEPPATAQVLLAGGFPGAAMIAWLRHRRIEAGVTLRQVAERGGWAGWKRVQHVEEDNHEPSVGILQRYARAIETPLGIWWEAL